MRTHARHPGPERVRAPLPLPNGRIYALTRGRGRLPFGRRPGSKFKVTQVPAGGVRAVEGHEDRRPRRRCTPPVRDEAYRASVADRLARDPDRLETLEPVLVDIRLVGPPIALPPVAGARGVGIVGVARVEAAELVEAVPEALVATMKLVSAMECLPAVPSQAWYRNGRDCQDDQRQDDPADHWTPPRGRILATLSQMVAHDCSQLARVGASLLNLSPLSLIA